MAFTGRLGTDNSQLGNIELGLVDSATNPTFTANAVLFKTISATFTADAFLAGTFTADAVILKNSGTKTFTANAVLFRTTSLTFTANADMLIGTRTLATFTANSVLFKTISSTKTANALLKKITTQTLTADAVVIEAGTHVFPTNAFLTSDWVRDTFSRTTSHGDVGQPSDAGHYGLIRNAFDVAGDINGLINGTYLEVDDNFSNVFFKFGPSSGALFVQFDYLVGEDSYYEVAGGSSPSATGPYLNLADVFIYSQGDGTWTLTADSLSVDGLTPTNGDWWTVKAFLDHPGSTVRIKTWKRGDPEPDWMVSSNDPNDFINYGAVALLENYIYAGSGATSHAGLDNLVIQTIGGDHQDWVPADSIIIAVQTATFTADAVLTGSAGNFTFTADSVIEDFTGTYQWGFTADAVIIPDSHQYTFTANSVLVVTSSRTFTADAKLVQSSLVTFTADAYIRGSTSLTFTANAVLYRPITATITSAPLRKTTTIHVAFRRPMALSAFVPPRNPEDQEQTDDTPGPPDLPCLPPCPPYPGGPGSAYGANGAVIRRSIIYCDACGVFYNTTSNRIGTGQGTTDGHPGCTASHSKTQHELRMFADYSAMPVTDVGMVAKLLWADGAPSTAGIKVFANVIELPPLEEDGDFIAWNNTFENDYWTSGDYLGTLAFTATDSKTTASGRTVQWSDHASSLTIRPDVLTSDIFRFEIADLTRYYGAEFRAPNVPVTVE
jgi:hypothetical protein